MRLLHPVRLLASACLVLAGALPPVVPGRARFTTFGPDQGFPSAAIHTLAQDEHGYIWLGTENGLIRYDGSGTTRWGLAEGLPSDWVIRLQPDPQGGLWAGTSQGLVHFKDGKVEAPVVSTGGLDHLVVAMDLDASGRLWVAGGTTLFRQVEGLRFEAVTDWPGGAIGALACGPKSGSVWVAGSEILHERRKDGTWRSWGVKEGLPPRSVEVVEEPDGRLWAAVGTSLLCLPPGGGRFEDRSAWLPGPLFNSGHPYREPSGAIWIPTTRGLLQIEDGRPKRLGEAEGLPASWARVVLRDREWNLWVSSTNLYRELGQGFISAYTSGEGLPGDVVWSVYQEPSGVLWVGTDDGACRMGPTGWSRLPGTEGMLVLGICQDTRGDTWFVSTTGPNRRLRAGGRSAEIVDLPGAPPRSAWVCPTPDGRVLFASRNTGLVACETATGQFRPALSPSDLGLKELNVRMTQVDGQGRIWCAANEGLLCCWSGRWQRWSTADGLQEEQLLGLRPMADGSVWVWYNEPKGLTHFRLEDGRLKVVEQLDAAHGLASDLIYALVEAPRNTLWITSDRGVDRVESGQVRHFGRGEGLVTDDCTANALLLSPDGDLWVATSSGLARIQVSRMPPTPVPPRPDILQISDGRQSWAAPFGALPPVPHDRASLEFRFSSPTFLNERDLRYQYRLQGLEDDWHATEVRQARYPVLPGGRYRFEVRVSRPGLAFGPVASVEVEVLPAWWQTWWFRTLEILAGLAAIGLVVRWRLSALSAQKRELEAQVAARTYELSGANQALELANAALREQSTTDPLTGLRNRRFLTLAIEEDLSRILRAWHGVPPQTKPANGDLVFFMVDLDHFKAVNDTYGHHAGDEVLIQVAGLLREAMRDSDTVVRWGGEEFLVLARDTNRSETPALAERLRESISAHPFLLPSGATIRCTCSIGFATFPFLPTDPEWAGWERIVDFADHALYQVKEGGRDGWAGLVPGPRLAPGADPLLLLSDLDEAVRQGLLELLQP